MISGLRYTFHRLEAMANEVVAAAVDVWAINQNSNQNGNLMEDKPIHLNDGKLLKSDEIL